MMRKTTLSIAILVTIFAAAPAEAAPPLPPSIASIGDSITRATNACCWYGDHPARSWSTGSSRWDGIYSHYERVLTSQPAISGRNYNDSRAGAKMADGPAQAAKAVGQQAAYVTILIGANDVCTSSPATMTTEERFRADFEATMRTLDSGLPSDARVFVSSIPNLYQLRSVLHTNWLARATWSTFGICRSMLGSNRTEADRQAALAREVVFNRILDEVCSRYEKCKFDDYAVFNFKFTAKMVSKLDYFHPSLHGQAVLAQVTWNHSWWGTQQ
jgi:lysophospholipase L1-like esterase